MPTTMNLFRARLLRLTGCVAASALAIVVGCAGGAAEATTRLEITDPVAQPGRPLRIWVACAPGSRLADVRSAVTRAAVLAAQPGGPWWFAAPRISAGARPGVYAVQARCTPGSGAPLAAATAPFRVSRKPQPWVAESTTAESITGDARFTPQSIAFAAGGTLPIRYLADVAGSVSVLGSSAQRAHGQLYRIFARSEALRFSGRISVSSDGLRRIGQAGIHLHALAKPKSWLR
jgi:hypothetical protein